MRLHERGQRVGKHGLRLCRLKSLLACEPLPGRKIQENFAQRQESIGWRPTEHRLKRQLYELAAPVGRLVQPRRQFGNMLCLVNRPAH